MISPTSSSGSAARPDTPAIAGREKTRRPAQDQLSTESGAFLKAELERQPEIRPDVVARARDLAADPSYPSAEVIRSVAQQILAAPDAAEQQG